MQLEGKANCLVWDSVFLRGSEELQPQRCDNSTTAVGVAVNSQWKLLTFFFICVFAQRLYWLSCEDLNSQSAATGWYHWSNA